MTQPMHDGHNALASEVPLNASDGYNWYPYDCVVDPVEFRFCHLALSFPHKLVQV